ncbi:MAG: DUF1015 family protein [Gemmatimonadaceae bacterium]
MPTIDPVPTALVPVDSPAADALGAPNYDEFQSDAEVWELLQARPESVLRATMPHCHVASVDQIGDDGSPASLAHASTEMKALIASPRTRQVHNLLWVYEIVRPDHPNAPQIGIGGMALTSEIRTDANPSGTIIRNEGIREPKARGRADLTAATGADMGTVNLAVDDASGELQRALTAHARSNRPSFETDDELGNHHRVWLVTDAAAVSQFRSLVQREPRAYVADGNHRSAAAAMLGYQHYLAVFFPAQTMTIAPYNRLVDRDGVPAGDLLPRIRQYFDVEAHTGPALQPTTTHEIGLYDGAKWWRLRPLPGTFDPTDAAQDIDADVCQRLLFAGVLGITDARDDRLTFVGANRDADWLQAEVDSGRQALAVTLPAVTMRQFIDVCLQGQLMPPKSTWFVPKIRSGLVMALLAAAPSKGST